MTRFLTVAPGLLVAALLALVAPPTASAAPPAHTDVMFVFDTSGSMSGALEEASAEIQQAMTQIGADLPDVQFGLAEVRDYGGSIYDEENPEDFPWRLDVPVTSDQSAVANAIDGLYAGGGGDDPEAYGRALWETDTNPTVGWRPGARHLIVLVADNVPHDNDLNEGIPEGVWVEPSPWETGEELREPAGVAGTGVTATTNLDWQNVLGQLAADQKPLEFVDYHGASGYLPYWENWASRTGGQAVQANAGQLVSELVGLAEAGAGSAPSAPPAGPCAPVHGSIGKELLASLKCTAELTKYEAECGFGIASWIVPGLNDLRALKTADGLYDLTKVNKRLRPLAKLINDIKSAKFGKHAPRGFRTGAEVIDKLKKAKSAYDVVKMLPDLAKAASRADFKRIAGDLADLAGLKPCIDGILTATE